MSLPLPAHLCWLHTTPAPPTEALLPLLGPAERRTCRQLRHPARQRGFLFSRLLLRHLLAPLLSCPAPALRFRRAANGRLQLAGDSGWQISLSHAQDCVAVMAAPAGCGVDLERPRPVPALALARRFFAADEAAWLATLPPPQHEAAFLRLWTLKEAAAKALGQGLAHNLARLAFTLQGPLPRTAGTGPALQLWQQEPDGLVLAAAVATPAPVAWHCRELRIAELLAP